MGKGGGISADWRAASWLERLIALLLLVGFVLLAVPCLVCQVGLWLLEDDDEQAVNL